MKQPILSPLRTRPSWTTTLAQTVSLCLLAAATQACDWFDDDDDEQPAPPPPPPPPPIVTPSIETLTPTENPIGGLGVTLKVGGKDFTAGAAVWLDLDRANPRRLDTHFVDATTLIARATRTDLNGSSNAGNAHVFVRQADRTSEFAVLNFYFACSPGSDTGPYGNFAGSSNGNVVLDASEDALRFRADNQQLVVDGHRLSNTVYDPASARVVLNTTAVGRVFTVRGAGGSMIAVLGNVAGTRLLDQTRGAVRSPGQRSCSAWQLTETDLPLTRSQSALPLTRPLTITESPMPCPAVEIVHGEAGESSVRYVNLEPGQPYWTHVELENSPTSGPIPPLTFVATGTTQEHAVPTSLGPIRVSVTSIEGCGSTAFLAR